VTHLYFWEAAVACLASPYPITDLVYGSVTWLCAGWLVHGNTHFVAITPFDGLQACSPGNLQAGTKVQSSYYRQQQHPLNQ